MNKRNNMLREKRKHANYKPNRRLDAKSSRGMIYENEELRIRTININAEVEKGQSEIKSLKREREQLRREIWTLRDEYDKLENLLRVKGIDPDDFLNQKPNEHGDDAEDCSEYSDCSCDECNEDCHDENQSGEKSDETSSDQGKNETGAASTSKLETHQTSSNKNSAAADEHNKRPGKDRLNLNFDHLSVVSEENSEGNSIIQNEDNSIPIHDLSAFLHSVDVLSPLSYLQKLNPPLAHFENLNYEQIGSGNVDQHGNILSNTAEPNSFQKPPASNIQVITNNNGNKPSNGSSASGIPSTANSDPPKKESRLKHFFSPIRKKPIVVPPPEQPDVFISNILPSNMYVNPMHLQNAEPPKPPDNQNPNETSPTTSFQTGGNLEELLFDIEALSKDIMNLQTQCTNSPADNVPLNPKKPFRSELNLVLSYPAPDSQSSPSSAEVNQQNTPPQLPTPMELLTPLNTHTNPLFLQNLPSPFPSPIPASPLTPPTYFNTNEALLFEKAKAPDYSHLKFPPINAPVPIFSSNNSIFCTVSAPSTPASDRKCIDKFCVNDNIETPRINDKDKKKAKRVSIVNTSKEESSEKAPETSEITVEGKESDKEKKQEGNAANGNPVHHGHRSHSHAHIHKRRMSLDNNLNPARNKNHRQICQDPNAKVNRRESNRSSNSFKKRSRSDSAFGGHDEGGTSVSERYSNSIASSRESSTSLSLKSGKRRISITSYGESKKIPWCGCWGSGCI